jgi:deoxyadenosine/deoxycytidine kinase
LPRKIYRNKGRKSNIAISIAGVHGVGKTTLFILLKKKLHNNSKFKFFPERYIKNPPFPFGSRDKQTSFRSEIHFLQQFIRRNKNVRNFDRLYNGRIIILDRTPLCALIYSKSLNLRQKDYHLIEDMYYSVDWKEDFVIYLVAKPETILKRIIQRGSLDQVRKEWNERDMDYLKRVLSNYEKMLISSNDRNKVFIVDTEGLTTEELLKKIEDLITQITGYSFKKVQKTPPTQINLLNFINET